MKLNESICAKVLKALEYGMNLNDALNKGFKSFARTINRMNALDSRKGFAPLAIRAHDGVSYSLDMYGIAGQFQELILPNKVSVLDGLQAVEARDVAYYSDNELLDFEVMTPAEFKSFQLGFLTRCHIKDVNFQAVGDLRRKDTTIEKISDRIAVHKGFNSIVGTIVECLGLIESRIATEYPLVPKFPIVVNTWYKDVEVYSYDAEDCVSSYFSEVLLNRRN